MSTETKVISLHGEKLPTPGEPVADVVKLLEEVLERARSGETLGVVVVEHFANGVDGFAHVGMVHCFGTIGALEAAKAHLL